MGSFDMNASLSKMLVLDETTVIICLKKSSWRSSEYTTKPRGIKISWVSFCRCKGISIGKAFIVFFHKNLTEINICYFIVFFFLKPVPQNFLRQFCLPFSFPSVSQATRFLSCRFAPTENRYIEEIFHIFIFSLGKEQSDVIKETRQAFRSFSEEKGWFGGLVSKKNNLTGGFFIFYISL